MKAQASFLRGWCLMSILLPISPAHGWFVATRPVALFGKHTHTDHLGRHDAARRFCLAQSEGAVESKALLTLRELYPPSEAHENGTLQVDSIHTLYYEVHGGNPSPTRTGKSALFLHGGPGAGCTPNHARFFDSNLYDAIVLFDQRGCGRSTPRGQIFNNTISHLIEDCERLREHVLGREGTWDLVLGGSWGSTLAIAYAQEFPKRVRSLILRGVCLLRPAEVDWLFSPQGGPAKKLPQAWQAFAETVGLGPKSTPAIAIRPDDPFAKEGAQTLIRSNKVTANSDVDRSVLHQYYDRLFGVNTTERWMAARGWTTWENTVSFSFRQQQQDGGSIPRNNSNASLPESPAVLVFRPNAQIWSYENINGNAMQPLEVQDLSLGPASLACTQLRQGLPHSRQTPEIPRPIGMTIHDIENAKDETFGNFSGLPAMPMLTCFYSVNDQYAMNGWNLLDPERMERIRHIPCIAVQGGRDPICPPDTALDVHQMWPEMELRIPLSAGHSMYHPELTHELVQATDRMAKLG